MPTADSGLLSVELLTFKSLARRDDRLSRPAAAPCGAVTLLEREKKPPSREAVGEIGPVTAARLSCDAAKTCRTPLTLWPPDMTESDLLELQESC